MNLLQSDNTYQKLIEHMESCGYSPYHIQHVKREIKWLSKNQDVKCYTNVVTVVANKI